MNDEVLAGAAVRVAQDLSAILRLCERLLTQAVHSANDREMPGGDAMVALANVANPEDYAENVEAIEWRHEADPRKYPELDLTHEDDDLAPVLQTLWFWSDDLRTIHGQPLERRATITSEVRILRHYLDYLWTTEPAWDDFARDIRMARRKLENILRDGARDDPTRVHCNREGCDRRPRLIVVLASDPDDDGYKCPGCKYRYDQDAFQRAYAAQLRSEGAERYVSRRDAISVLNDQGTPDCVVRKWLEAEGVEDVIEGYCEVDTRRSLVWWPSLWRRHLMDQQVRKRVTPKSDKDRMMG